MSVIAGGSIKGIQQETLKTSKRNREKITSEIPRENLKERSNNSLEEIRGRISARPSQKSRENLLESNPGKLLRRIPIETMDKVW